MTSETAPEIPAHVPSELVRHLDIRNDPDVLADPWAAVDRLREDAPLLWSPELGSHWIVTSAELVRQVLQTPDAFPNYPSGLPVIEGAWPRKLVPLQLDGDEHTRYRRLLTPLFSPRAIRPLTDLVREHATRIITSFAGDDRVEFHSQLAIPLPSVVFLGIFGIPVEQMDTFQSWVFGLLHSGDPEAAAAAGAEITGYLAEAVADRMREPREDLISELAQMEVDGRPLTAEELLDMSFLLFLAGLDTVSNQLSVITMHLARDPGQQQALRDDPSLIENAVEELLRLHAIAPLTRTVGRDFTLNGVRLRKGDRMLLSTPAAGRDPAAYDDPLTARFDRANSSSAAFGLGPHRCAGMHLARQELRIVLELMTTLVPPFRLAPGARWQWHAGEIWGLDRLDLEFVR